MKKYIRTIIAIVLLAGLGLGYYYYLSNRPNSQDATAQAVTDNELSILLTKNISGNYPQSVKEVVELYMRITKAYYNTDLTDNQIETLGKQARILFDDELKSKQTEADFLNALKEDIKKYESLGRRISEYQIEKSADVEYKTLENKKYASIQGVYYIREKGNLKYSYTKFTLRKDADGNWKILFWELANQSGD